MSKFVLIDHSLSSIGGHHYEYAWQMLRAAADSGYETHLACGAEFADPTLSQDCLVHPTFPYPSYGKWSRLYDGRQQLRELERWKQASGPLSRLAHIGMHPRAALRSAKLHWRRQTRKRQFVDACRRLFEVVELHQGDQVYLPTVSEFDLSCLAAYLDTCSESAKLATWHAQMHLSFWDGRTCERTAGRRARIDYMVNCVRQLRQASRDLDLHLYTTTIGLADQYNELQAGEFTPLPYPAIQHAPSHAATVESTAETRPLRIVVAGKPREEKGTQHLHRLVDALWDDYFARGRLQLLVQTDSPLSLTPRGRRLCRFEKPPVVAVDYPLTTSRYADLIRNADIGLFMYDAEEYYVRASGVLVEMLAMGKPVITPAGCWLSQQTERQEESRLRQLQHDLKSSHAQVSWQFPIADGKAVVREQALPDCDGVLWRLEASSDTPAHVRIEVQTSDAIGHWGNAVAFVCETKEVQRGSESSRSSLTTGLSGATRIRVRAFNAYDARPISLQISGVPFDNPDDGRLRLGDLSLTAADWASVPRLLADMVEHYYGYRRSALVFSRQWAAQHSPARTIEILQRKSAGLQTPLARAA
jgi:glycosyltransferase involved in cell wall biosynthesis